MEANVQRPPGRIVTRTDYVDLKRLVHDGGPALAGGFDVQRVLQESTLVASSSVAPGVITMGSQVFLVTDSDELPTHVTLVYPHAEDRPEAASRCCRRSVPTCSDGPSARR